jgi:glycine cleavage system aminomethyltransferase T
VTPFEAGLAYAVKLDKAGDFIGKAALLALRGQAFGKRLVTIVLDSGVPFVWGGEAVLIAGVPVGELTSVGWSPKAQACIGLAYLRGDAAQRPHAGTPLTIDLWSEAIPATAWDRWPITP